MASIYRGRVSRRSVVSRKRAAFIQSIESLEPRTFLNATVVQPIDTVNGSPSGSTTIDLSQTFSDPLVTGPTAEIQTPLGNIPLILFQSQTPKTFANFEHYITTPGEYNGTIVHRSIPGFIIQGGGFTADGNAIPTIQSPPNEPGISNTAGTIAMAKIPNNPSSATDQWFINLADNSSNLDQQNGGFTVFGKVIYKGMDVANQIAGLPTVNDSQNPPGPATAPYVWSNLPVINYTGSSPDTTFVPPANMVTTNIVNVSALTYAVTSDNPSVVTGAISGNSLQLNYGADGTANVTVTATDLGGNAAAVTFTVNVSGVANTQATIGKGAARVVHFTDPNGVAGTATLAGPGTATFTFNGVGITTSTNKAGVETVTGTPSSITIATTGTTAASTLSITGAPTIAGISADNNLGAVNASKASLSGSLTVPGSIGRILLGAASGGTIMVNGSARPLTLSVGTASSEGVNSSEAIASLTAGSWTTVSELGSPSTISAPSIGRLSVSKTLNAHIATTGDLRQANVGTITTSTWSVSGAVGGIAAGSITGLNLSAGSVGRITSRGDATNVVVNSTGNIAAISAPGLIGSRFYAGGPTNDASGIPTAFPTSAAINSVIVGRDGFNNSVIGAATLGRLNLGNVPSTNGGTPFGLGTHTIASLLAKVDGKRFSVARVTSEDQITAAEAKAGITANDLVVRIV
jgi:cyclophilin family peptidyl-prolyl cis-trans isomerase